MLLSAVLHLSISTQLPELQTGDLLLSIGSALTRPDSAGLGRKHTWYLFKCFYLPYKFVRSKLHAYSRTVMHFNVC